MLFERAGVAAAADPEGETVGLDVVVVVAVPPQAVTSASVTAPMSFLVIAELGKNVRNDAASDVFPGYVYRD
jgi:hypothetical protein